MKPVLLLSNGHGEDLSGALVASQLIQMGIAVEALPLVGHGTSYRQLGIAVLGRTRNCSTGGLGYTSLAGRIAELLEGQMLYVLNRLLLLRRRRHHYGLVLAVGDLLAVLGGWFSGLPTAVYLVAYSSHYEGRLRLPWPCGWLLGRPGIRAIWSRDELSAADLSRQLGRPVCFLGNPFLDAVSGNEAPPAGAGDPELLLVPGSRLPEAARNLALMLELLAQLPGGRRLRMRAALVPGLERACIAQLAAPLGWQLEGEDRLVRGPPGAGAELGWVWATAAPRPTGALQCRHRRGAGGGAGHTGAAATWPGAPIHAGIRRGPAPPAGCGGVLRPRSRQRRRTGAPTAGAAARSDPGAGPAPAAGDNWPRAHRQAWGQPGHGRSDHEPACGFGAMTTPPTRLQQLKGAMDTLLVVDVFVVIAGALWFAAAVALHSQHVEGPLTLFQKLWEPLFTPAIGLLMGAALLSGVLGWWQRRGQR